MDLMRARIAVIGGTRPEAIKLAPVLDRLRRESTVQALFISTGQHREMLNQVLSAFDLRPDLDLDVMRSCQDLYDITTATLAGLKPILREFRPDWIVVQGDTTSAMAGALAAFYEKIPIAHVEAGLRTYSRYRPFPEELNRRIIDQLSSLLFAPTEVARDALRREGFKDDENLIVTGNTVVDALHQLRARLASQRIESVAGVDLSALRGRLVLVTSHRRESFGDGLASICRALGRIVELHPDVSIIYPVHLNPNVDGPVRAHLSKHDRIMLLPPVSYMELAVLLDRCYLVLTDSGGIQEEAPSFSKPLLVLRDVTERPEGITAGVARLVGTREDSIVAAASELLTNPASYAAMTSGKNPYGDGRAAVRIVDALLRRSSDQERTRA
jgi:UDP-N-acetylglucosamine 2-epimerase (non-hydrolysing)